MALSIKLKLWQKVLLLCLAGVFVGGGCLFLYMLRFTTYLGDDPSACVNCHIMQPYYATWNHGATEAEMKDALQDIRKSQWRWDYAVASHGASFHAPQEVLRLMGNGITYAQEARLKIAKVLAKHGFTGDVPMPDISTKAKAQAYIGLDMPAMESKKTAFMETIVPQWLSIAKDNGKLLDY